VVLLLDGVLVSWSRDIDEHDGHEDLCGSGHRSVIPYIHRRTELYCSSLPCLCEPEPCLSFGLQPTSFWTYLSADLCEVALARAFYSSRLASYNEP
jgi:hypothetical protein